MTPSKKKPQRWAYYRHLKRGLVYAIDPNLYDKHHIRSGLEVLVHLADARECIGYMSLKGYVRCRKDGEYYQSSIGQQTNRRWLSLNWQLQGAIGNLRHVLRQAQLDIGPEVEIALARWKLSERLEARRLQDMLKLKKKELISSNKNSS